MADAEQIQQIMATLQLDIPTIEKYKTVAKEFGEPEKIEELPGGGSFGWFGSKTASKVLGYIPGGGFISYASVYQVQTAYDVYKDFKSRNGVEAALAVLSYDVATVKPFPAQLHQTVRFVQRLLEGRKAENIELFGESAGGALIIGSILHLHHPHPKSERLSLPKGQQLGRILLISPSGPIPTSAASFTENMDKDSFKPEMAQFLWDKINLKENHDADIPIESSWLAPALKLEEDWYSDWPVADTRIIWGNNEILRDDIARVANVIKARSGKPVRLEGIDGATHCPYIFERLMKAPPGAYAQAITKWGQGS
ncbi:hypothetical protein NQ176_g1490 [Zarea fungicola]|uniref:Uncharacterized protein n=1 Tax=Zarea fungicola TaxID=93591 RepID=A0ACC1NSL3_9HYPO|nr:hypothetical protein NQ176_g1490 [Lecanicillium fungicola]